jgi:hypothetical protein
MSAPIQAPQIEPRPVCWLCERKIAFASSTDKVSGLPVHSHCADVRRWNTDTVFFLAREFKPKELARELFDKDFHTLTLAELDAMIAHMQANRPKPRGHHHTCFQCGVRLECYRDSCTETAGECRPCHEGYTQSEWNRYHRKHGN